MYNSKCGDLDWKLPKSITIVKHKSRTVDCGDKKVPIAFVVFDNNIKTLQTAYRWACHDDSSKNITVDGMTKFNVRIIESADNSSFGGKLSFCLCEVYSDKRDIDFVVGINSDILFELIFNTTFAKGVCQSKVVFVRHLASLGLTTLGSEMYNNAVKSEEVKEDLEARKTTKWKAGYTYMTKTTDVLYVGDLYKPVNIKYSYNTNTITYTVTKKKSHLILNWYHTKGDKIIGLNDANITDRYGMYDFSYTQKFTPKAQGPYKKVGDTTLKRLIKRVIAKNNDDAAEADHLTLRAIEKTLMSNDGKLTAGMLNNITRLLNLEKVEYDISEANRAKGSHIVKCADTNMVFKFDTMKEAVNYIISVLSD